MDLNSLLSTGAAAANVYTWTQNSTAAAQTAAYCAWIESIIGTSPAVERIGTESRARVVLTTAQVIKIRQWLDKQLGSIIASKKSAPAVDLGLASVVGPWALQYAAPLIIAAILAGWFANKYLGGRK
jgi:hypothetical protein